MTMISLRNIEKSYQAGSSRTYVLRQINLGIRQGDFLTIMGPSGAGKSTLLSILGMLDSVWGGQYDFLGHAVHGMKPKNRVELNKRYIGFVFQQYHLLDDLTVYENLDIPLSYRNIKSSQRAGMVAEALDRFQIVGKKDLYPRQLSGGQQQLVAVANVTNLLLVRAAKRDREFAIRAALGASRGRVTQQLLVESLLLALLGCAAGMLVASWGLEGIRALSPPSLPRVDDMRIDARALGFALAIALVTACLFGVVPALRAARSDLTERLKEGARPMSGGLGKQRLRSGLIVGEVALAIVLLVGGGLLVRSFVSLLRADRGFRSDHVLTALMFAWQQYPMPEQRAAFVRDVVDRISTLPGVRTAGAGSSLPLAEHSAPRTRRS